jgi:steroid delta-isomerase-like uncharacterized protein
VSAEQNVALARRFFEELCNQRNAAIAEEILSTDHRYHDPQIPDVAGPQAMMQTLAVFQNGVEGHWGIQEIHAAGDDRVVVRWRGTGQHSGDVMGIPPSGKPIAVDAISVMRIENGKIADHWCVWDTLGFLQQIGAAPAPVAS